MRVIAKSRLKRFWEQPAHGDARGPLESWHGEMLKARWKSPQALKAHYPNAHVRGNGQVAFTIGANYRLAVEMQCQAGIVWVRSIGTQARFDKTDRGLMAVDIKPIRNDEDLAKAFSQLEQVFHADAGTPEADKREILAVLIEAYENARHPIVPSDPVAAIRFRMEQQGLTARHLEAYIGGSGRVSEVLNRKRPLSLRMMKRLHEGLQIPYECLLAGID